MHASRRKVILGILALATLASGQRLALADGKRRRRGKSDDDHDDDHEAAARARADGEILPLTEIIEAISHSHPGEIVGVELERDEGIWIYEIKLVTPEGRYLEIYVDARDKQVVKIEDK